MTRTSQPGFTLVETLVALSLIGAVALPTSLWLYRTQVHWAARERFLAVQALEDQMNRVVLLRQSPSHLSTSFTLPKIRIRIRIRMQGKERHVFGYAVNHRGKEIASLETILFEGGNP